MYKKKIGILTTANVTDKNMEQLVYNIPSVLKESYDVEMIGLEETSERIRQDFTIFVYSKRHLRNKFIRRTLLLPLTIYNVYRYSRINKPDVLMTLSNIGVNGLSVALVGKLLKIPTIVRTTSDIFERYKYEKSSAYRFLRRFFLNNLVSLAAMRLAGKVIVLHEGFIKSITDKGIRAEKLVVIPQPINFASKNTSLDIRKELDIDNNLKIVLYVGRIDSDKNISILPTIIEKTKGDGLHFIIIGDGRYLENLRSECADFENVSILGKKERDELPLYYTSSDIFIQVSHNEGLPTAIAEALYFNLPVVCFDSGPATRAMVSNIAESTEHFAELLTYPDLKHDPFPEKMLPENNRKLLTETIENTLKIK